MCQRNEALSRNFCLSPVLLKRELSFLAKPLTSTAGWQWGSGIRQVSPRLEGEAAAGGQAERIAMSFNKSRVLTIALRSKGWRGTLLWSCFPLLLFRK